MELDDMVEELYHQVQSGAHVVETAHKLAAHAKIKPSQLLRSFYRHTPHPDRHRNFLLSSEQEKKLALAALTMSTLNEDWSVLQTQEAAQVMFGIQMSENAILDFRKRHHDCLSLQVPKSLGKKRQAPGIYDEVLYWSSKMNKYLDHHSFVQSAVVNYDECRIVFNNTEGLWIKRLISKKKKKPQNKSRVKGKHIGTYIPFVSADGEHLASFFIFPANFRDKTSSDLKITLPSSTQHTRSAPEPPIILFNETGYLQKEDFKVIMEEFILIWKNRHPGLHCCLIGDNLKAHRNHKFVANAMKNDIFMIFLVADTTHWSQPLDTLLFALLKQKSRELGAALKYLQIFTPKELISIVDIVMKASKHAFQRHHLMQSFKDCGLWPFNPELIKELAAINHDPSKSEETYTDKDDIMVKEIIHGLNAVHECTMEKVHEAEKEVESVSVTVKPHVAYTTEDLLALHHEKQQIAVMKAEEKEKRRAAKLEEKKRKAEEKEEEKNERKRRRLETKAAAAERLEKRIAQQEMKKCKANCGHHWVKGLGWTGCEHCDIYWVCPSCWKKPQVKKMLHQHEESCSQ
jgi:hypothetical protein